MTMPAPDDKNYDVQFSIRVPKSLADEINARAEREGIRPSTWIRNAIAYTIEDKDKTRADDIRTPLLHILQKDEEVRAIIREIILSEQKPARNINTVKEELSEIQNRKQQLEEALQDTRQKLRHTERLLREQKRVITHLEMQQKKLLGSFLQNPGDRNAITSLDQIAASIDKEKENFSALTAQLNALQEETAKYEALCLESNASYLKLREEMNAQNENERREYFNRLNRHLRDTMK